MSLQKWNHFPEPVVVCDRCATDVVMKTLPPNKLRWIDVGKRGTNGWTHIPEDLDLCPAHELPASPLDDLIDPFPSFP